MTEDFQGVDLIGDVHGCAISLCLLLDRMGYRRIDGVYQHPTRKAFFIGDIVDRGPHIREALHIVRAMVDAGQAGIIMGNHEYNLLCYLTPSPDGDGFLREHNPRHQRILQQTLDQFADHPEELQEYLQWFMQMPLFVETGRFRAVHACWSQSLIDRFRAEHPDGRIDQEFLLRSSVSGSFEWDVMDRLLRGTHLRLPNDEVIVSRDGFKRKFFRTKFWAENPQRLGDVVFQPDPLPEHVARREIQPSQREDLLYYGPEEKLLFMGHYWCEGAPEPITDNIVCLDYSAVKYGKLVAYRLDDETRFRRDKFVWVDVAREVGRMDAELGG
ncbi:metallophosphoesterase [Marinobacterium mangrovicola]|uniref:Calcineurin-like phosphoesterase family protein n=1 Tax=Marinobacterium mangrovicola TaxID=1476959 RepID=A0A4V2PEM1_9GAMM|nr:metallophosphoesterase [Marinobacterium mangrovicola]TCK09606.1 calcineurin-like phosphoesterase family protein [Marinobacterium mangrovicola]